MVESFLHVNVLLFISCRIIFVTKKVGRARAFLSDLVNREKEIQKIPLVFSIISLELQDNEPTYCSFYSSCCYFDLRG